jgi:hypothetical protein
MRLELLVRDHIDIHMALRFVLTGWFTNILTHLGYLSYHDAGPSRPDLTRLSPVSKSNIYNDHRQSDDRASGSML